VHQTNVVASSFLSPQVGAEATATIKTQQQK
jgi:hypothetical protein